MRAVLTSLVVALGLIALVFIAAAHKNPPPADPVAAVQWRN